MIDLGRKKDMGILMMVVNDPLMPLSKRRQAHRTMLSIRRKMSDKVIQKLRLRLIAASMHSDVAEVEKISERIQDYERKHYLKK